eukprot:2610505-Rhodomonas_salina.1
MAVESAETQLATGAQMAAQQKEMAKQAETLAEHEAAYMTALRTLVEDDDEGGDELDGTQEEDGVAPGGAGDGATADDAMEVGGARR